MGKRITHLGPSGFGQLGKAANQILVGVNLMAVIWGINFVVVKYATHIFNPVAFTGLRVGIAALFLVLVALVRGYAVDAAAVASS